MDPTRWPLARSFPRPHTGMKALIRLLVATTLALGSGCAKQDWIDRTLVTVDVTGTWSGTMMAAGSGGAGGARDVVFELEQKGSMIKGTMRVTPRGMAPDTLEGTVAGDVFRFKDPRANWEASSRSAEKRWPVQ